MHVPYIQQEFLKYNIGKGFISGHAEALHAAPPNADQFTDVIVENIIKRTGCAGIISTVSRVICDLNRVPNIQNNKGVEEYRRVIREVIEYLHIYDMSQKKIIKPYLHLSFHGMKDKHYGPASIEIGTLCGRSCSPEIRRWFREKLIEKANGVLPNITIVFDKKFKGDASIAFHRQGDGKNYAGYGPNFHSLQIELSYTLRKSHSVEAANVFADIMSDFQTEFVAKDLF